MRAAMIAALALLAGAGSIGCGGGASSEGNGGSAGGTGGTGSNPSCEGAPTTDATLVRDECGVFVSASAAPGGDGTKAKPFATFADAAAAGAKRVFACAETYTETVQVTFSGGVEVYGGFTDCTASGAWSASSQAEIATVADAILVAALAPLMTPAEAVTEAKVVPVALAAAVRAGTRLASRSRGRRPPSAARSRSTR